MSTTTDYQDLLNAATAGAANELSDLIQAVSGNMANCVAFVEQIIEAATAAGCTRWQTLRKVKLRLALPEMMLGVNQTVMMGLSMLVITALVGTRDLGQEVYIALTKADSGRGLVAGASVACIAMITDRLISAWSRRRKRELGLD